MQTVRHFFGGLNQAFAALPDTRFEPFVDYPREFLMWWGILMYLFKLGSRRQLDFALRDLETHVLENVNRLAGTNVETLPVHDTLDHFLGHVRSEPIGELRTDMTRGLIRSRVLDPCRLRSKLVMGIDGTGFLHFKKHHCDQCLTQDHDGRIRYFHPVLEAKIVGAGLALSVGTEFIENPPGLDAEDYQSIKQDCELKAFYRLAPRLKAAFPRTALCLTADSLFACGPVLSICEDFHWSYVFTLKPDAMPAVWQDVTSLLELCPENKLILELPDKTVREYRWVNDVTYTDSYGRDHTFNVIILHENSPDGTATTFSWMTDLRISQRTVDAIATKGGRKRWNIENQGFNTQKNSGLNLEHAYSHDPDILKSFYYLLQIAHLILQLVEKGSLLGALARDHNTTVLKLFGSLRNIARCLLECFRCHPIPDEAFDFEAARHMQIRLDTS